MGSAMMPIEGLFLPLASIQAQIIGKGIRRNSLSIRRFWGKGERWKRKRERAEGEKPLPLPHLKSPLA